MRVGRLALSLLLLPAHSAMAQVRHALVIGNNAYPGNELRNAVNDARAVHAELLKVGYDSTLLLNGDRQALNAGVDHFVTSLRAGDTALLYYAGHGLQLAGENYLVPTDFRLGSPGSIRDKGYSLSEILERFTSSGSTTEIVILDSCRDNPFLETRSTRGGWAAFGTSAGTFLAFGTSPGSTASDDPSEGHGLFTKNLLPLLTQSDLDIEDMFRNVREAVIRESKGQQVPWVASSLIGTFHVRPELDAGKPLLRSVQRGAIDQQMWVSRALDPGPKSQVSRLRIGSEVEEDAQIQRAIRLARGSRFQEAIDLLQDVLSIWPESSAALRLLGLIFHVAGHDREAAATFDRALRINSRDAEIAVANCAVQGLTDATAARQLCETIVTEFASAETYLVVAANRFSLGEASAALAAVNESLTLRPSALGFALRGRIESERGEQMAAQQDFSRAMKYQASPER